MEARDKFKGLFILLIAFANNFNRRKKCKIQKEVQMKYIMSFKEVYQSTEDILHYEESFAEYGKVTRLPNYKGSRIYSVITKEIIPQNIIDTYDLCGIHVTLGDKIKFAPVSINEKNNFHIKYNGLEYSFDPINFLIQVAYPQKFETFVPPREYVEKINQKFIDLLSCMQEARLNGVKSHGFELKDGGWIVIQNE